MTTIHRNFRRLVPFACRAKHQSIYGARKSTKGARLLSEIVQEPLLAKEANM